MEFVISKWGMSLTSYGRHVWEFFLIFDSDLHECSSFSLVFFKLSIFFIRRFFFSLNFRVGVCRFAGLYKWTPSVSYPKV